MKVERIELFNYRNYHEEAVSACPGVNAFVGRNAQGKTNILEAIYYSALARSHRSGSDAELIRWGEDISRVFISFSRLGVENALEFQFDRRRRIVREIFLNGCRIKVKDLIGSINVVLFSPEDLFLIKGSPSGRRRFLDMEISQSSRAYFHDLTMYSRALSQRNSLLKRIRERSSDARELTLWDEQLAPLAASVVEKRIRAVEKLGKIAGRMQMELTGGEEELSIRYETSGPGQGAVAGGFVSWYNQRLRELSAADIARGATGIGPHRDDLSFFVNGADLRSYGSQGQQRTGVLALKLAELEFFREEAGEYPVMLLDDVMSELDSGRREKLLSFIRDKGIQTFITATDEAYLGWSCAADVFFVEGGKVTAKVI